MQDVTGRFWYKMKEGEIYEFEIYLSWLWDSLGL